MNESQISRQLAMNESQISRGFSLAQQQIAVAGRRDSSVMLGIAVGTLTFLPATALAVSRSCASVQSFHCPNI